MEQAEDAQPAKRSEAASRAMLRLRDAWQRADALFEQEVGPGHALTRPIELRHPFVFYLGHLPAFARNTVRKAMPDAVPEASGLDDLFSRGMDPDVEDPTKCHAHPDAPDEWPEWSDVVRYKQVVREEVCAATKLASATIDLIAEHDLMHIETLYYMLAQRQRPTASLPDGVRALCAVDAETVREALEKEFCWLRVPEGSATIGARKDEDATDGCGDNLFLWDNEFGQQHVDVSEFEVTKFPITVKQFAQFVAAGGYDDERWWTRDDWAWVKKERVRGPASWRSCGSQDSDEGGNQEKTSAWVVRTVDKDVSLDEAASWPVYVSLAEARAFAQFVNARLLSEPEWDRMVYGDTQSCNSVPWIPTCATSAGVHGNFGFCHRHPVDVNEFPDGKTWVGAVDTVGNGWELVDSVFNPLPGFSAMPLYEEYSSDFFDDKHFVLKGASWATQTPLVRRSFRNFYQAHYPYVFSKFRLAR